MTRTATKHDQMKRYAVMLEADPHLTAGEAAARLGVTRRTIQRWRAELELPKPPPFRPLPADLHGTTTEYDRGCRCASCRAANTARAHEFRNRLKQKDPAEVPHGYGGYNNYGCRCEICTRGNRDYQASPEGRAARRRYNQSEKGRAAKQRYNQSEEGRAAKQRYQQSEEGRAAAALRQRRHRGKAAA